MQVRQQTLLEVYAISQSPKRDKEGLILKGSSKIVRARGRSEGKRRILTSLSCAGSKSAEHGIHVQTTHAANGNPVSWLAAAVERGLHVPCHRLQAVPCLHVPCQFGY